VDPADVELLIMKAMSLELIKGTIDEVDQVVHVDWVKPRYLSKSHLQIMVNQMNEWEQKLDQTIRLVENNSAELVQS
jgi:26S proteasome regulatory subunit N9